MDINAPMGSARLAEVTAWVVETGPRDVVDLGCGHGVMAIELAKALGPHAHVTGIDVDGDVVRAARERAAAAGVADRCTIKEADVAGHHGTHDASICVGSTHAFGGIRGALDRMIDLTRPGGVAVVGDGVWATKPDAWCRDTFGDLPTRNDLISMAGQLGWEIEDVDGSTLQEWDDFEAAWTDGVEGVGTQQAIDVASQRREEYRHYRGVLGFAWLLLRRP